MGAALTSLLLPALLPAATERPPAPWGALAAMLLALVAACTVFVLLVRRWTSHREWVALSEWADDKGMKLNPTGAPLPEVLAGLTNPAPVLRLSVSEPGDRTRLVQVEAPTTPASRDPARPSRWNLVVRRIESAWPPTALRPATHDVSVIDFFPLGSFPSLSNPERFVLFGSEAPAARALAKATIRALLPKDVGLLLHGHYLLLDFSTRPYDPIELERMIALVTQLVAHLPAPDGK